MSSIIKVETLQDTDGNNAVDMQFVSGGSAKAWVMYDQYNGNNLARGSLNISSVTDDATGIWTNSFTNNMNDYYYCNSGTSDGGGVTQSVINCAHNESYGGVNYRSSSSNRCGVRNINDNSLIDRSFNTMSYLGDLA
jgi:hypothetical protein